VIVSLTNGLAYLCGASVTCEASFMSFTLCPIF
jgi:hypothetical protein